MPRRQGHPVPDKPWFRERFKSRRYRKRTGSAKEAAKGSKRRAG